MTKLRNLDLKLLQLFEGIYLQRNLSKVAEQMNLSQPAVSIALGRLRQHFDDPLFVRVGAAMEPTPVAEQLYAQAVQAVAQLEALLAFQPAFDPGQDARSFRIAMTDVGQVVILPRLLNTLAQLAPHITIDVRQVSPETTDQLQRGLLDLALGSLPDQEGRFVQQPVFLETFSCLVRRDHPRITDTLSVKQYQTEQHVIVETSGTGHAAIERDLARHRLVRQVGVRIPHFIGLPAIVGSTDLLATLPSRAAHVLAQGSNVRVLALPVQIPGYPVRQQWHERVQHDPGHIWLRQLVAALFKDA
ncbi:MAG: LysR family transcriptional regulator [Rhodoferax sp.]|nr:LysR family transcriptional regulator [Rhodoferax sp.]